MRLLKEAELTTRKKNEGQIAGEKCQLGGSEGTKKNVIFFFPNKTFSPMTTSSVILRGGRLQIYLRLFQAFHLILIASIRERIGLSRGIFD
jgi:hypothetical protein